MHPAPPPEVVAAAVADRHRQLSERVTSLSDEDLSAPSSLPGWSRLTVICHLRYGAQANLLVTEDMLAGRVSSYYPHGRAVQRQATLRPAPNEQPGDVVTSFVEACAALDRRWQTVRSQDWSLVLDEPEDNRDLGPVSLAHLAGLRLTEAEVHGTDLVIGLSDWSSVFVSLALPQRLLWLPTRRSNHGSADRSIRASWLLQSSDGPAFLVAVDGHEVRVAEVDEQADHDLVDRVEAVDAVITGSARQLLGFLLGRIPLSELEVVGDRSTAERFLLAFPSP